MSKSGSPQQHVKGQSIPRRVVLNDLSQLPNDYSTTPGGSLFSTTPGGTKIFYERNFLMQCRNSPLTRSPPPNMAKIPGVTCPGEVDIPKENGTENIPAQKKIKHTKTSLSLRWTFKSLPMMPFTDISSIDIFLI